MSQYIDTNKIYPVLSVFRKDRGISLIRMAAYTRGGTIKRSFQTLPNISEGHGYTIDVFCFVKFRMYSTKAHEAYIRRQSTGNAV